MTKRKNIKKRFWIFSFFLFVGCLFIPSLALAQQSCESLTGLKLKDTTITSATSVPAAPFKLPPIPGFPGETPDLPAFCRVLGSIKPTADSDIRFEVWLPAANWNGRFLQMGNAGFAGMILPHFLTRPLSQGYATAATDNGHQGVGTAWAIGHPEKVVDFAYRAVHLTSETSKEIIKAFYAKEQKYSYFSGCSEGGREGLMEAQRYPEDFDGIISGNPGHVWNHLFFSGIWNNRAFQSDAASYVSPAKFALVEKAAVETCDAKDGVKDGIISDPLNCNFDAAVLLCKNGDAEDCLTQPQITALKKIYSGPKNLKGERINFGLEPGVESLLSGFSPAPSAPKVPGLADFFFSGMVYENPKWDVNTLNFDESVTFTDNKLPFINATNPDLKQFKARGGKLLHYHGWRDQGVPPMTSVDYYESVMASLKGLKNTQNFYRLFMPPGMNHCFGGPGPNSFGNVLAPPPPAGDDNDILKVLEKWVEKGIAPNKIIATKYADDEAKKGVAMTRPLCPYPQQARWTGKGSPNDAANFVCKNVKVKRQK